MPSYGKKKSQRFTIEVSDCRGSKMILVTRINKKTQFYVNEDMIEFIEETPDTILSLNTGKRVVVMETALEVIQRIHEEKIRIRRASQF